jgi:hypothetical protein
VRYLLFVRWETDRVAQAMATFGEHQNWEETRPGQLWDSSKE